MSEMAINGVSLRRTAANVFLKGLGVRRLHGTRAQRLARHVLAEIDFQHLRDTHPCPSFATRTDMHRYLHAEVLNGVPIDYLEFGVYRGESITLWASMNTAPQSRFYGFDSFAGLPEDWRDGQRRGHFDTHGAIPRLDDPRVTFIKGWFTDTVPTFARHFTPAHRLVLHLDADLYSSTMLPLVHFDQHLPAGTLLIFDEFYDREHEYKALIDWQHICGRRTRVIAETHNFGRICAELL
jgi:O-methyltransferase